MAYSIASFLLSGQLDTPAWRAVRRHLWRHQWTHSEVAYAVAVSIIANMPQFNLLLAHEVATQFNQMCAKRGSLFTA